MSAYETANTLPGYHLYKADHMSMAASLEVRVPFLSTDIVEFAHSLPAQHKVIQDGAKRVLKRAISDLLPEEIVDRKRPGMRPPVEDWFRGEHEAIETWFTEEKLGNTPYLSGERATDWRAEHRKGNESVGRTIWMILTYVAWYHTFVDDRTVILDMDSIDTGPDPSSARASTVR